MKQFIYIISFIHILLGQKILIPMDIGQRDHLKAYGLAFWILESNTNVEWLLNYRGGSFLADTNSDIEKECRIRGINYELINAAEVMSIYGEIERSEEHTSELQSH